MTNPRPPYSLRHYYATQRLLEGVQVYDLAKNMGTSVKQIENHYGHVLATQKTNELILGAGISSWQEYQESDEYKLAQEEIKADQEEIAKSKEYIRQLQSDMEHFKRMSSECDRINIDGINVYGLTATDYKLDNPDEVITTFLGHFTYQNHEYALITFLDAPKGIKSTFGFNSSGWNATELARKIVESVVLNANLTK